MAARTDDMKTTAGVILFCAFWATLCGGKGVSGSGLAIDLPQGWETLHLGSEYRGVGAYCDAGIIELLIERLPFDEKTRVTDLERQIVSSSKTEALSRFGRFRGHGFRKSGLTSEGDRMSFLVFYLAPPAGRIAILVICGDPSERQLAELYVVVNSLQEVPCGCP